MECECGPAVTWDTCLHLSQTSELDVYLPVHLNLLTDTPEQLSSLHIADLDTRSLLRRVMLYAICAVLLLEICSAFAGHNGAVPCSSHALVIALQELIM